ncbi:MAG: HaeIII family restriction endonuclease [Clostridiales Family XIII bacterium]|jgi:hypothetical protein|nr:HaeIII family restriction endonuclease [Clostridiales Family XIII bacterium]
MPTQSEMGKSFEYAVLKAIYEQLAEEQPVSKIDNTSLDVARGFYDGIGDDLRAVLDAAAVAAIRHIVRLEPQLVTPAGNTPLYLSLQEDAAGQRGDVRDVLIRRQQNAWEIGISCKHNHSAVKHSRLSKHIDFGQEWLGVPCSQGYFDAISPIFDRLAEKRREGALWSSMQYKATDVYIPVLTAFSNELERIATECPDAPASLIRYLLGRNDFYKAISHDSNRTTTIQAFNLDGTLNKNAGAARPLARVSPLSLPTRIVDVSFKEESTNTIIVTCNHGWSINMRIHSASSRVEASLKFDVKLEGMPPELYTAYELWGV